MISKNKEQKIEKVFTCTDIKQKIYYSSLVLVVVVEDVFHNNVYSRQMCDGIMIVKTRSRGTGVGFKIPVITPRIAFSSVSISL